MGARIGQQSTHLVQCAVCDQRFGNAVEHRCPFVGADHANMHRESNARVLLLVEAVKAGGERVRDLEDDAAKGGGT